MSASVSDRRCTTYMHIFLTHGALSGRGGQLSKYRGSYVQSGATKCQAASSRCLNNVREGAATTSSGSRFHGRGLLDMSVNGSGVVGLTGLGFSVWVVVMGAFV